MIELALPAGSLENALCAFSSGADAVYFGMKDFSARKGAVNFSTEDLSKIRRFAQDNGKKIYVTVNTLVDDGEIVAANTLLSALDFYQPDGLIIQDLGLVEIVRRHYPGLPLHASTQLAVHTAGGVRELQDLGFERIVLSRELTLDEIWKIRQDCPDVELKVFIHGALCYGFSGLCMASANLCGRSANRGECAQICRSWFTEASSGRNGYFFSLEDLCAGELLRQLNEMGIDSAKIEGRLKGDAYIQALTRYYRAVLDGTPSQKLEDEVRTSFSRKASSGYFNYRKGRESLLSGYPGHLGLACAKVVAQKRGSLVIETYRPLEDRDGLQYIRPDAKGLPHAAGFACQIISHSGNRLVIRHSTDEDLVGTTLYKTSSASGHLPKQNTKIPLYRKPVDLKVTIGTDCLEASAGQVSVTCGAVIQESRGPAGLESRLTEIFRQSGDSRFTAGKLDFINNSGLESPFVPPSVIKELRRKFYAKLDSGPVKPAVLDELPMTAPGWKLPERGCLDGDLPWGLEVKAVDGHEYITLPPVTFDEEGLFSKLEQLMTEHHGLIIGLNNISQVGFAKRHPGYRYFADIYLYLSNRYAARLLKEELGESLIGGYLWLERDSWGGIWPFEPAVAVAYTAPSFISRACFRHDSMGLPCSNCNGKADYAIRQNAAGYKVKVRDCMTIVQLEQEA